VSISKFSFLTNLFRKFILKSLNMKSVIQ
jgi:hypothetical protein